MKHIILFTSTVRKTKEEEEEEGEEEMEIDSRPTETLNKTC
jgi:hypothetical protein